MATPPTIVSTGTSSWTTTTSPETVSSIAVQAGDIVGVVAGSENQANTLGTPTDSSPHLTYTLAQSVVVTNFATAYAWTAPASGSSTFNLSVTRTANNQHFGVAAAVFRGSDGVGASAKANTTGAPSLSITTTQDNSAILVLVTDWDGDDGATRTWRTVNGITPAASPGNGYEFVYQRVASTYTVYAAIYPDAGTAGAKTVGLTTPSSMTYSIVAVEIMGAASGSTIDGAVNFALTTGMSAAATISAEVDYALTTGVTAAATLGAGTAFTLTTGMTATPFASDGKLHPLVEAAFGADRTADPDTWDWTDITDRVLGPIQITRGTQPRATRPGTTTINLRLNDTDSALTPRHQDSPWLDQWGQGTPLRCSLDPGDGMPRVRAYGYVDTVKLVWPAGNSRRCEAQIRAVGMLGVLAKSKALRSAQYRAITATAPLAYWPLEDGANTTLAASPVAGCMPATIFNPGALATVAGAAGSAAALSLAKGGRVTAVIPATTSTSYRVEFDVLVPTLPEDGTVVVADMVAGQVLWEVMAGNGDNGGLVLQYSVFNSSNVGSYVTGVAVDDGQWHHIRLDMNRTGVAQVTLAKLRVDDTEVVNTTNVFAPYSPATTIVVNPGGSISDTVPAVNHLAVWAPWSASLDTYQAFRGWTGETPVERMVRTCAEEGVPLDVTGTSTRTMGPQPAGTLYDILCDAWQVDQGVLRDGLTPGVTYLTLDARYNVDPAIVLTSDDIKIQPAFQPVDDTANLANDVTATRPNGGRATVSEDNPAEPFSTVRIGDLQVPTSPNVEVDEDLQHQAGWRLWLGTVAEMRIPSIGILPSHSPAVRAAWLDSDLGSRYTGDTGLDQMAEDVDQVLDYYIEAYDATEWRVQLSGSPGRAYDVAVWETPPERALRWDSHTSTLAAGASAGATSLSVTHSGIRWVRAADDAASLPFDIEIGARKIHVTAVTGTGATQTFTVDPIPADVAAGKPVRLWRTPRLAL